MTKTIVAIVLTLIAFMFTTATSNPDIDTMAIMNACNESSGYQVEMANFDALNMTGSFMDETDQKAKCFIHCVLESTNVLLEDGTFDQALATELFDWQRHGHPVDDIGDMIAVCVNRPEKCPCEKSYQFLKCLMAMEIEKYGL